MELLAENRRLEIECETMASLLRERGQTINAPDPKANGGNIIFYNEALTTHHASLAEKLRTSLTGGNAPSASTASPSATTVIVVAAPPQVAKSKWEIIEQSRALTPTEKLMKHQGVNSLDELKAKAAKDRNEAAIKGKVN